MEWLFGLALLPLVVCGAMCAGGVVVAVLAGRRAPTSTDDRHGGREASDEALQRR